MLPLPPEDLDHILAHTDRLWEEARGRAFFVTGGTGFFGCWLVESFLHANNRLGLQADMTVLTRSIARFRQKAPHLSDVSALKFIEGDAKSFVLPDRAFDFAVHAATETLPDCAPVDPWKLFNGNIEGTRRFLELVRTKGVQKFLFISSGAVYGPQPAPVARLAEDDPFAPNPVDARSTYGESKRVGEMLCALQSVPGKCEGKVARCFAFVGPHLPLDANYAIGNFIRDALQGGPLRLNGDGTPRRSYLYAADLAIWLWTLLFRGRCAQAYNVGAEEDLSIRELAETVRRIVRPEAVVEVARPPMPGAAASRYIPDVTKARSELDLTATVPLEEAIRRTAEWYRALQRKSAGRVRER
jgi:dTDP-glucose 4,6-dehydratase